MSKNKAAKSVSWIKYCDSLFPKHKEIQNHTAHEVKRRERKYNKHRAKSNKK